jgi:hypothetical protein
VARDPHFTTVGTDQRGQDLHRGGLAGSIGAEEREDRSLGNVKIEFNARREAHRGSRDTNEPNVHPQTCRTYILRGMVFCGCGRRMSGNHRHGRAY